MTKRRNDLTKSLDESSYMLQDKKPLSQRRYGIASPIDDWGWYVVSGCAFANFLLPGMLGSFGLNVLDEFVGIYELESKNGFVSRWISTTFNLMFYIAGSLSCLLCELTSHRAVMFWGGILASVGMMSSSFANSTPFLYISYGIMVGFGAGLCYPPGMLIVNEYFNERKGLANGLSLVGTTVGSLALPPYLKFLTSSYGYRGAILIVSGILLNVLACALTYKPVDKHSRFVATMTSSSSKTSINAQAIEPDDYYAAVVSSPSPSLSQHTVAVSDNDGRDDEKYPMRNVIRTIRQWLSNGGKPTAEFVAVSTSNAVGHLAYATFTATAAVPWRATTPLQLAAADAAGRLFAPVVSDLLSSGDSASVYLNAAAMAIGGVVLLSTADRVDPSEVFQQKPSTSSEQQPSSLLSSLYVPLIAFVLTSGAAIGLEPLVAVHVLGRERLAVSYFATLLGKGVAQLAVDLLMFPPFVSIAFYVCGFCLVVVASAWVAAFLFKCYYVAKDGCSPYVRTT